ncbi:type II toxin-antitoxin system RelE/ParE family toxin [Maribellus comscasis]|uniref:Type II toxin-antitoxin system RelE/ParE family toxin n=1 Tax=Maribellus comscasis TaxID=2681766 RepID=A0A6I6JPB4_9BACT|nr:type II toxin-antitoxin system RelE/ParE family toxin [Maribellus comscasis]QGY42888.1 type II toxin-antitoxin system RelE/ParE family toxin [Maribellus comscasis]
MKVSYSKQFIKDIKKYPQFKNKMKEIIADFQNAESLLNISHIKKLQSTTDNDYRLRVGNFRIGFSKNENTIFFKRFLHRKDIYKYFP